MLYLYAITESPRAPDRSGLRGSAIRAIPEDGVYAVVSEHEDLRIEASEEDLWTHEEVVEELMRGGAVLPMRLGTTMRDEPAVRGVLAERGGEFRAGLDRVRGAVELGVRALIEREPEDASEEAPGAARGGGAGTAYMLDRLETARRGDEILARIHEPLAELARDASRRLGQRLGPQLTASYLVDRERVDAFRARVEKLDDGIAEVTIVCTGPWPPYSFSGKEAAR